MGFLKTSWHHVRRSPYQTLAAVLVMSLTFFIVSIFTFVIFGSSTVISYFESKPQVTVFFKDEAKQENIDALKEQLKETGKISRINFVSKQGALKIYREQNKNDPLLLDLVTADILPSSLEISTTKIEDLSVVSEMLKNGPFVQEVIYQKDIISTLTSWTNALRKTGAVLVIIFSFVSIFIMLTIIGLKISQKREEIEIMRLLGATSWYVRWPFIFEGIFYGIAGAFVGWLISIAILLYATPSLSYFMQGIPIFPIPFLFMAELLGAEILLAIFLGAFSSFLAVFIPHKI